MSKTAQRILSNTAIQIFGKLITAVVSIVIIKYITSLEAIPGLEGLPAEYKLIYTYLAFFGIIADFGLFTIAVREMSQARDKEEQINIMGNIFGMRLFTIITAMALASLFVFLIPLENYSLNVKYGVAIAAVTTVFTMMASSTSSILQVHLKMAMPTITLMLGKLIMGGYIIWVVTHFTTLNNAFYHLLYAGIFGTLFTFLTTFYFTRRWFFFKPKYEFTYWKRIFKEALPYGIAIILSTIYFKVDVLLLSFFRDKQEIAIYGYPSSIIEMLAIFPIYFMNSTLPTLSRAFQESKEKAKTIISLSFQFIQLITFPLVVGGLVLARPIIEFIMNEEFLTGNVLGYYGADTAFQLLLFPTLFAFINTLFSFTLIANGNQSKLLKINLIGVLFNIITNIIFIPHYGFIAAGITTFFSELIIIVLTYRECQKDIQLKLPIDTTLKTLFASLMMGVFVYMVQGQLPLIPLVLTGALVFFLLLIPLRILNTENLKSLRE
jgi:O-antigen/teichoic acid export membrane protein